VTEPGASVIRTGTAAPAAESVVLHAGPVRVVFADGDLRQVRRDGTEIVRRVYVAIRDLDWNTLPGEISDLQIADDGGKFRIRFTRRHRSGGLDYQWQAEIDGEADGTIRYRMHGAARSAFPYAKIGICVHHPTDGFAGQPYHGTAPGGPVDGRLPDAIGPQIHLDDGTDLPLFEPVSDLAVTHESGGVVRFEFSGDLWEMEDQRNWTDASYKSASTPASLGYHHEAAAGDQFDQQVVIRAAGLTLAAAQAGPDTGRLTISVGEADGPLFPPVGLRCADPAADWSDRARAVLRAIGPAHLRADYYPAAAGPVLAAAARHAADLGCGLELAVFLPAGDVTGAVARLADELRATWPPLVRVLAFCEAEESSSPATVAAVGSALAQAGCADVPVVAGTNVYFNELNRHRLPPGRAAGLAWSVNPQIHAFDDLSLMENLQAQPATIATARSFAPGAALFVTPITLRPRFNAVAVTDQESPAGALPEGTLPWPVDVRQPSLFGAAWTLGSLAALGHAGADGLTYYDTVGPAGVIESPAGSPAPAEFFSRPDTPYPLAVVLADAARLAGGRVCRISGADPARVAAIAVRQPDRTTASTAASTTVRTTVLLANLTAGTCEVAVALPAAAAGAPATLRILDEHSAERAATDLPSFLRAAPQVTSTGGTVLMTLNPYGTARLEVHGG
jgi:D-apionolactonase